MLKYITKRIVTLIPILVVVSLLTFLLVHFMPGDPARIIGGETATQQDIDAINKAYGFDKPIYKQYYNYISNIFKGDLGTSIKTGRPVINDIKIRFPNTLKLSLSAMVIAVVFGTLIGIVSATKKYSFIDNIFMLFALIGVSTPSFYLGLMLMLLFSVKLGWVPMLGDKGLISLVLPAIALSVRSLATMARMTRSSMIEVMSQDYILSANAQGFSETKVVFGHALKNAMITIVTIAGLQFGYLLGGAVVTEKVFAYPGLGQLTVDAIRARDFPTVQAGILVIATTFVLVNLLVDVLYAFINPQIKYD